uniref:G_PROTEIN_RECEP_F1_2 domain-containing protein n=1 Tax=Heterorhabditis bacteriophora TaxID=37862 RepID=A0A1I7WBB0_HETBA
MDIVCDLYISIERMMLWILFMVYPFIRIITSYISVLPISRIIRSNTSITQRSRRYPRKNIYYQHTITFIKIIRNVFYRILLCQLQTMNNAFPSYYRNDFNPIHKNRNISPSSRTSSYSSSSLNTIGPSWIRRQYIRSSTTTKSLLDEYHCYCDYCRINKIFIFRSITKYNYTIRSILPTEDFYIPMICLFYFI